MLLIDHTIEEVAVRMIPAKATAALMLLAGSSYCALADMPGADWMNQSR